MVHHHVEIQTGSRGCKENGAEKRVAENLKTLVGKSAGTVDG